jgi:hypothetical protein
VTVQLDLTGGYTGDLYGYLQLHDENNNTLLVVLVVMLVPPVQAAPVPHLQVEVDGSHRSPLLQQVADISSALLQALEPCRSMPGVKDVRVKGAVGVVEMNAMGNLDTLRARFVAEGVFVRPFGNIIYLTPAFTIAPDELKTLTDAVAKVVRTL